MIKELLKCFKYNRTLFFFTAENQRVPNREHTRLPIILLAAIIYTRYSKASFIHRFLILTANQDTYPSAAMWFSYVVTYDRCSTVSSVSARTSHMKQQ
jgi:hypothetical protein